VRGNWQCAHGVCILLNNDNYDINIEYAEVEIRNRKTGFGSSKKPVFGFAKNAGFPGYPVSVKTGLQSLPPTKIAFFALC